MPCLKWGLNSWKVFCCLCLLGSIIIETEKYLKNNGKVSEVAHRIFHQAKEDRYPIFSLCLEMLDTYSYNLDERNVDSDIRIIGNAMPISSDSFLISTESIAENGRIQYKWGRVGNQWNRLETGTNETGFQIYESNLQFYENPNLARRYCLTRNNSREESRALIKNYDIIKLNKTSLMDQNVNLMMYIHHPGQLMRSYHKHDYWAVLSPNSTVPSGVVFKLVFVSVSRLRESAVIGCLKDDGNEDMIRRHYIANKLNCIPSHWIPVDRKVKNMSICPIELLLKLPEIYQTMNDELTDKVDIRTGVKTNMRGSCDRMSVISLQDEIPDKFNNGSILTIKIRYVTQSYQQIITVRDVTITGLFALIGGYFGLFVGVSLMQVPDIIISLIKFLKTCKKDE